MRREGSFRKTAKRQLDDSIHAGRSLAARHAGALLAYERLLRQVQTQTNLLYPSDRAGDNRNLLNAGLMALALRHADWLRPSRRGSRRDRTPGRCSRLWRTTCSPCTPSRLS